MERTVVDEPPLVTTAGPALASRLRVNRQVAAAVTIATMRLFHTPEDSAIPAGRALIGLAIGAAALGAMAIGALAIGRLVVRKARIETLSIGELTVDKLIVRE